MATRLLPWLPAAVVAALVARVALSAVLEKAGHPAVPLDDAFIHFQYAKRLAHGRFFSYVDGDGFSSGATSLLWPALLAPLYALGLRDLSIIWGAWFFGWAALVALAVETYRLSTKLTGRGAALGAGAMVLAFGGYVWCASSGMEVTLLAWWLARTGRLAADWGERAEAERSARQAWELALLGLLGPLVRPEGALASAIAAAALVGFPAPKAIWRLPARALALVPLVGPAIPAALNVALTGHAASSTTLVKWLPANPYYADVRVLGHAIAENLRTFYWTLLDGREWSAVFVPAGARPVAIAALWSIPVAGWTSKRPWRAAIVLALALGMLLPTTYLSFLWNRLRYLWPFAFAWFVGAACAARVLGEVAALVRPRWVAIGPVLAGLCAGALASHLSWTIDDLATSAAAVDKQQVALGRWAATALPADARIGVNDTGAIAYVSDRRTFDVVGLTTPGEARYWVAGAGSRFEHYERLAKTDRSTLPTHFIVYPNWMACDAVLGEQLHEATVTDQTILGGTTMIAYAAKWDLVGSGDAPAEAPNGRLVDELDVADLESESAHAYEVAAQSELDDVTVVHEDGARTLAEGVRQKRTVDRFVAHLPRGVATTVVARLSAPAATELAVTAGGVKLAKVPVPESEWTEVRFVVPASAASERTAIEVAAPPGATFGSMHYWFHADEGTDAASVTLPRADPAH